MADYDGMHVFRELEFGVCRFGLCSRDLVYTNNVTLLMSL